MLESLKWSKERTETFSTLNHTITHHSHVFTSSSFSVDTMTILLGGNVSNVTYSNVNNMIIYEVVPKTRKRIEDVKRIC